MLTNNFKKMLKGTDYNTYSGGSGNNTKESIGRLLFNDNSTYGYFGGSYGHACVEVGGGDTAPAMTDYNLVDSNYWRSSSSPKLTKTAGDVIARGDDDLISMQTVFTNNTESNITVKEVGLYANMSTTNEAYMFGLFARKVLDTPVTIAPGETYSFIYTIKMPLS